MSNSKSFAQGGSCSVTAGSGYLNPVDVRDAMLPWIFRLSGPAR